MNDHKNEIYNLLLRAERREKRKIRENLLQSLGVSEEYFEEGSIKLDSFTCRGTECGLCIKVCPMYAFYWNEGKIQIEDDLCIYCGACVLSCIVDNCIIVTRKRKNEKIEKFGTPRQLILLMNHQAVQRREAILNLILKEMKTAKNSK